MFGQLEIFQLAQARAKHAGARQAQIAANIANADTPGFRATDIKPFQETYRAQAQFDVANGLRLSRPGHTLPGERGQAPQSMEVIDRPSGASPNGNTVSLEIEMLQAIDADRAHNRAVTVFQTSLGILRSALKGSR